MVNTLNSIPVTARLYVEPVRACPQPGNALGFLVVFQLEGWFEGKVVLYLIKLSLLSVLSKPSSVPNLFKAFL